MQHWAALRADVHRQYGSFSFGRLAKGVLLNRTLRPLVTLRLCQHLADRGSRIALTAAKVAHQIAVDRAAIELSWRTEVGPGLALTHGRGIVVNPDARIGANVTLFHGVTLGGRDRIAPDGSRSTTYPTLEDEVWVGPQATIVGGVTIGAGSRIAAGAFVTENIPPHSIVVGNPAIVVKSGAVADVANRAAA